jgi:phosphatidylserine synthase 2
VDLVDGIKLVFFFGCLIMNSWVSGALDPESGASGDLVTSVKRFVLILTSEFYTYYFIHSKNKNLVNLM